jgi:hypothetical protein
MFGLVLQAQIAIDFTLRAVLPLTNRVLNLPPDCAPSIAALRTRIVHTQDVLQSISAHEINEAELKTIHTQAGQAELTLTGEVYVQQYALPNFFFHLTMVYSILRLNGVALGKANFDGFHQYAAGFRFESAE